MDGSGDNKDSKEWKELMKDWVTGQKPSGELAKESWDFKRRRLDKEAVGTQAQEEKPTIRIMKDVKEAIIPTRGSWKAAGLDLYSAEDVIIHKGHQRMISTGIRIALPPDTYGRIAPKSSLAARDWTHVNAGVIDEDFRGVLKVLVHNLGNNDVTVRKGDQVAQLIVEKIMRPAVKHVMALDPTARGEGGFGSTTRAARPNQIDEKTMERLRNAGSWSKKKCE